MLLASLPLGWGDERPGGLGCIILKKDALDKETGQGYFITKRNQETKGKSNIDVRYLLIGCFLKVGKPVVKVQRS